MIIGIVSLIIFLFTVYQLSKEDFLFLRKGVSVENVFNIVFLGLPIVLLSARIFYIVLHPNWHYLNPLVFFIVPYFPGLSLIGGIIGAWIFVILYTKNKKIPSQRLLDMLSLAFLLTLSIGILLQGAVTVFTDRFFGLEEIGRGIIGIILYIFLLLKFTKGSWVEGSMAYLIIVLYCLLAFVSAGAMFFFHHQIVLSSLIATALLSFGVLCLFILKQPVMKGWKS